MKKIILSSLMASTLLFGVDYTNSIGMVFKEIPAGSFLMGTVPGTIYTNLSGKTEKIDGVMESPQHKVTLDGFYMQETEVTQGQWYEVMGNNPAVFKTGDSKMPIEMISWDDAKEFILRLNQKEGTHKYRLPTEEEWEYAARAGTTTLWYCGESESCVSSIAVYGTESPKPVKSKKPNAWGLYDMSGNVRELTDSCWTNDYNAPKECTMKVVRGGSWGDAAYGPRSANRTLNFTDNRDSYRGFRLLRMK